MGVNPSASASPTHWLSMPALPSVTTQQERTPASEPKHVVQAEGATADEPVIAKQPAGGIAHDDVTIGARRFALLCAEGFVDAPQVRSAAGDLQLPPRHFLPLRRH